MEGGVRKKEEKKGMKEKKERRHKGPNSCICIMYLHPSAHVIYLDNFYCEN